MKVSLTRIWSPDLAEGEVPRASDFSVFVQIGLGVPGEEGDEVFQLTVCTPGALSGTEPGTFVRNTLVLDSFDWSHLRARIEKLLLSLGEFRDWSDVVNRLEGYLHASDAD